MKKINRREFIKNAGLISLAGLGGVKLGFAQAGITRGGEGGHERDLLIYVFLEGGMDGLHLLPPNSGKNFTDIQELRPNLHVPNSGPRSSIPLTLPDFEGSGFGFHPSAGEMAGLFNNGKMAIIHATGLLEPNLSHFESTGLYELGIQQGGQASEGWVTRLFRSTSFQNDPAIHAYGPSYYGVNSFAGHASSLVMLDPANFALNDVGFWRWRDLAADSLTGIFENPVSSIEDVGNKTLESSQVVLSTDWEGYLPGGGAVYPVGGFGEQLKKVAQLSKVSDGLEVAYVPYGGWDTHINQDFEINGDFSDLAENLSKALNALYLDLSASIPGGFTIVVQSEFGRRAYQNDSGGNGGTDHGYGNPMFVIGDNVNPGIFGEFPGLDQGLDQLVGDGSLAVTVDYRDVVSEILMKRMKNRYLGYIFPGYSGHQSLGVINNVVNGANLVPVYDFNYDSIFQSGFDGSE